MEVNFRRMQWEYISALRITNMTRTHVETITVELTEQGRTGRGEAAGIYYHGENVDSILEQLSQVAGDLRNGPSRSNLSTLLPPGGARNAVDCALWDLEAKRAGKRVWDLLQLPPARPLWTTYTLSVDSPETMARAAAAARSYSLLKLKLDGGDDVARVAAVRKARPDARLVVDANQGWSEHQLREFVPQLAELGVTLIEQPLSIGQDDALVAFDSPIALCADESCQTVASLHDVAAKYQYINIKLDKTGGLTEALHLAREAQSHGLRLMVGCMGGSSLAMAPAFVVGQMCEVVDLDSPLLKKTDVDHPVRYDGSRMGIPEAALWG